MKQGCTVVSGYTPELQLIADRMESVGRGVVLFENDFVRGQMIDGPLSYKKPPRLPHNVVLTDSTLEHPVKTGIFVICGDIGLECGIIDLVTRARVVGQVDTVKRFLKGRKFYVLNCWNDFICVELAD